MNLWKWVSSSPRFPPRFVKKKRWVSESLNHSHVCFFCFREQIAQYFKCGMYILVLAKHKHIKHHEMICRRTSQHFKIHISEMLLYLLKTNGFSGVNIKIRKPYNMMATSCNTCNGFQKNSMTLVVQCENIWKYSESVRGWDISGHLMI